MEREVIVSNDTTDAQRPQVYVGDATIDDSGFVPADGQGEVASWSEVNPSIVELDPGERQTATVTIEVPDSVTNGERYGVVWVQPPAGGGDIQQVNRVGVRIYLTVSGGADPEAEAVTDLVITSMTADTLPAGDRQARAAVTNTGERAIDLVGVLELLDGPGGLRAGPFPTDEVTTVAIGGSALVSLTISSEVPPGGPGSHVCNSRAALWSGQPKRRFTSRQRRRMSRTRSSRRWRQWSASERSSSRSPRR